MKFEIPTKYLWIGGAVIAAGLLFWYLKSSGIWDSWFNSSGQLVPAPPVNSPDPTQGQPSQSPPTQAQQQQDQPTSFSLSYQPEKVN